MGKEANLKAYRKQLRNVIKEPGFVEKVLTTQLIADLRKELGERVDTGIRTLNQVLHERLDALDNRTKDLQKMTIDSLAKKDTAPVPTLLVDMGDKQ